MSNSILAIIVTYNGMKWIDKCIRSVLSSTIHSDIFVVDNASSDDTPDYIAKNFPKVLLTRSAKNLGFGAANNIGLQYAIDNNYDYVYLLNQDAWVKEDTFEKLILTQKKHLDYGILSPIQLDSSEKKFDFGFGWELSQWKEHSKVCEDLFFKRNVDIVSFNMIMAAHWLISRDCLLKTGGFSPAFFHYGEDNNYAERVQQKGYKIGVAMDALAIHDRTGRIISDEKKIFFDYCLKIVEISSFSNSIKCILWNYTYDTLLKIFFLRTHILCRLKFYHKFIFSIPKLIRIKKESFKTGAFLKIK